MHVYTEEFVYQVAMSGDETSTLLEKNPDIDDEDILMFMMDWCSDAFDKLPSDDNWYCRYDECAEHDIFCFKEEAHRTWFLMRFSV